ncbi:hypothetical protein QBC44DRAFT_400918 [Cladorrhinum sp. PSN332]|nr:hypothetical protein QBC44DRAFT_400918 [Cladorrhinum sp. PSN332]
MTLVVTILIKSDGLALNSWSLPIQPNSLIAVFTTIGKASLLVAVAACLNQLKWEYFNTGNQRLSDVQVFDDASRGPWGSLMFLGKIRASAVFGHVLSLITIAALGIEPSAQQVLSFETRNVRLNDVEVTIGMADMYASKAYVDDSAAGRAGHMSAPFTFNPDNVKLQAAIIGGTLGSVSTPSFSCPPRASKCSWPVFSTMGLCSTFQNVTEIVKVNCTTSPPEATEKFGTNETDPDWTITVRTCHFNFPPHSPDYPPKVMETRWISSSRNRDSNDSGFDPGPRFYFFKSEIERVLDSIGGTVATLFILRIPTGEREWKVGHPIHMFQSTWYWCQKTFHNVTASNGGMDEGQNVTTTPLIPWRNQTTDSSGLSTADFRNLNYNYLLTSGGRIMLTYKANSTFAQEYTMAANIPALLFDYLSDLLGADVTATGQGVYGMSLTQKSFTFDTYLDSDNIENITSNIAATISNQMRSNNPGDNAILTLVDGDAFADETFIQVRWGWLTLPLAVTVLAIASVGATIMLTREVPLYKGSTMALITYRVEGWEGAEHDVTSTRGERETAERLEESGKSVFVRFERDRSTNRWGFRRYSG